MSEELSGRRVLENDLKITLFKICELLSEGLYKVCGQGASEKLNEGFCHLI
jgi:hypothetical protein